METTPNTHKKYSLTKSELDTECNKIKDDKIDYRTVKRQRKNKLREREKTKEAQSTHF